MRRCIEIAADPSKPGTHARWQPVENPLSVRLFPQMNMLDERSWLSAARLGERWALEQFYHSYQAQIYSLCYRMLGRAEDAEDAMQSAFVRAFQALPNFRADSSAKTWIYRIAVNEALSLLRKRKNVPAPLEENVRLADGAPAVAERLAIGQALRRVKVDQRAILILRYWEELSYEEIADILGISLAAVKMRLNRAREDFRKRYGDER
jgi:RNA polymerase sigma-70 factor (ECF subfamily)